jgi:hypothetical protein
MWHVAVSLWVKICTTNKDNSVKRVEQSYEVVFFVKRRQNKRYASGLNDVLVIARRYE